MGQPAKPPPPSAALVKLEILSQPPGAQVLELPRGLGIMTIHALCGALLRRFPLEAGVSPQFRVLDDREAKALRAADPPGTPGKVKVMFADNELQAEDLLSQVREAGPSGDD